MTRITVLGGTGYAGSAIVADAAKRGFDVVSFSTKAPASPVEGVDYRTGSALEPTDIGAVVEGSDVVVSALAPRGPLEGKLRGILADVARLAATQGIRFGVVGGAGSLYVAEGGPRLVETDAFPDDYKPEALELTAVLEDLTASSDDLDWFFVSPAAGFGAFAPGEATGNFRIGTDYLLADEQGNSYISSQDLATAIVNEIAEPQFKRARFTAAY